MEEGVEGKDVERREHLHDKQTAWRWSKSMWVLKRRNMVVRRSIDNPLHR